MKKRFIKAAILPILIVAALFAMAACAKQPTPKTPLALSAAAVTLRVGESVTLSVENGEGDELWQSGDSETVSVSSSGELTALCEGKTTVTVTVGAEKASCEVTVTEPNKTDDKLVLLKASEVDVVKGGSVTLEIVKINVSGIAAWSSNNDAVATVSQEGKVTALGRGTAKITVTVDGLGDSCVITVLDDVLLVIERPSDILVIGENRTLPVLFRINGEDADPSLLKFTSSNPAVAAVSEKGVVSAKAYGSVTLTASYEKYAQTLHYDVWIPLGSKEDFTKIKDGPRDGSGNLVGNYILTGNIDFGGGVLTTVAPYTGTKPDTSYKPTVNMFNGLIEGQGHSIRNFSVNTGIENDNLHSMMGVIGPTGTVRNLKLSGVHSPDATAKSKIMGTVASVNMGVVENVWVSLTVDSTEGCNANNPMGGIVCDNRGIVRNSIIYLDATAEKADSAFIGALIGKHIRDYGSTAVENCFGVVTAGEKKLKAVNFESVKPVFKNNALFGDAASLAGADFAAYDRNVWRIEPGAAPELIEKTYDGNL